MLIVVRPRETRASASAERAFGFCVDRARGFVEHEQSGVAQLGTHERDELSLTDRQRLAALADHRLEAVGKAHQPPVEPEPSEGAFDVVVGRGRCGHAHVVGDRRVEQEAVLRHHADRASA